MKFVTGENSNFCLTSELAFLHLPAAALVASDLSATCVSVFASP
jgi:hypothetical protein